VTPTARGGALLLIVEEDPALREVLAIALRGVGYEVTAVADQARARRALERGPAPCCVVLAIDARDDWRALREWQASRPALAAIPVVALAEDRGMTARVEAHALGVRWILPKPVDFGALVYALAHARGMMQAH
jgi:CheY-like chemotaxis protein